MRLDELQDFFLVGETALSLKYGHRKSIDLDLFCNKKFDHDKMLDTLKREFKELLAVESLNTKWGIFCFIDNIKVDLVYYPHPIIKKPEINDKIRLLSTEDIISLKLNAILGRGKKKDFYDLDELLNHFQLKEMIQFHKEKFPSQNLLISIPQAIIYFEDAEGSPEPVSLKGQTWSAVKKHIQQKVGDFLA